MKRRIAFLAAIALLVGEVSSATAAPKLVSKEKFNAAVIRQVDDFGYTTMKVGLSATGSAAVSFSVKPGIACTKAGTSKVVNGKRYTCIRSGKRLVWSRGVPARPVAARPTPTPAPTSSTTDSPQGPDPWSISPEPIGTCQIPDARTTKTVAGAIAYPVTSGVNTPGLPSRGTSKVAVIPIDFSDVPGTESPSVIIDPIVATTSEWLSHFSNGKFAYQWETWPDWIRAPKPSSHYAWEHPGAPTQGNPYPLSPEFSSTNQITAELASAASKHFDFRGVALVFFIYPRNVRDNWEAMTGSAAVHTPDGTVYVQSAATGGYLYFNGLPIWAWFMHENLHALGLAGHAPADAFRGIMSNETGADLSLSSWETLILDWAVPNQFYCVDAKRITPATVTLSPIASDRSGTKAVMIRTSDHTALVIESRSSGRWSSKPAALRDYPKAMSGITITRIDTSIDRNRAWSGTFAELVFNPRSHGGSQTTHQWDPLDPDVMFFPGETVTVDGVTVTAGIDSGLHTVSIS